MFVFYCVVRICTVRDVVNLVGINFCRFCWVFVYDNLWSFICMLFNVYLQCLVLYIEISTCFHCLRKHKQSEVKSLATVGKSLWIALQNFSAMHKDLSIAAKDLTFDYCFMLSFNNGNKLIFLYLKTRGCIIICTLNIMYIKLHKLSWIKT